MLVSGASGATYVGVSSDPARRLEQHNGLKPGGAKATRGARPWSIAATFGPYPLRGEAQQIEHRVKRLRGRARLEFALEPPTGAAP